MSMTNGRRGGRALRLGAMVAVALVAGACDEEDPIVPDVVVYEGELAGAEGFDDLAGTVSIEVGESSIDVTIALSDYPSAGDGFPWMLREGTCADPGDPVGELDDYPLIELDDEDEWTDEVTLTVDDEADAYVIELRRSGDDEETVIACGDLAEE